MRPSRPNVMPVAANGVVRLLAVAAVLSATACSGPGRKQAGANNSRQPGGRAISPTDPCAERLHALCGPLLLYYAVNKRLPGNLEELQSVAGPDPDVSFTCPASGADYVYDPAGLTRPGQPGRIILYDAEPSHAGMRWAVVIEEHGGAQPLITRVVGVAEPQFPRRTEGGGRAAPR